MVPNTQDPQVCAFNQDRGTFFTLVRLARGLGRRVGKAQYKQVRGYDRELDCARKRLLQSDTHFVPSLKNQPFNCSISILFEFIFRIIFDSKFIPVQSIAHFAYHSYYFRYESNDGR